MTAPNPLDWFDRLVWLDGRNLLSTIEPYRRELFRNALYSFGPNGFPVYNRVLSGRAKKNFKTTDLILAALYRFLAWPSPAGNDCFVVANDEEQAGDDLSLAKKLIAVNPPLSRHVKVQQKQVVRTDGRGKLQILPAQDVSGLHGKTYSFLGFDEIHGYKNYDLFEALSPDPTRLDTLTWITSYAAIRFNPGIPLFDLYQAGRSGEDERMLFSWYGGDFTTDPALMGEDVTPERRANPSMASWGNPGYLEDQRRRLPPHKFRRLHLNLPGAPDGAAFNAESVLACVVKGRRALPPRDGVSYLAFVDMSGGSAADAVLCIAHIEDGKVVIDQLISQTGGPPFNPQDAVRKFVHVLREYRLHRVVGDKFAGETFKAAFEELGVQYVPADQPAAKLYEALEPKINAGLVELSDVQKLHEQLLSLVVKGGGKIGPLSGEHDDWANALAGAVYVAGVLEGSPSLIRVANLAVEEEPEKLGWVSGIVAAIWVNIHNQVGVAYVAFTPQNQRAKVWLLDFAQGHADQAFIWSAARRLDELSEWAVEETGQGLNRPVDAVMFYQEPTEILVRRAMNDVFDPRLDRVDMRFGRMIAAEPIPEKMVHDPVRLKFEVWSVMDQVRVHHVAREKHGAFGLASVLQDQPGERLGDFPVRAAAWVLVRHLLGEPVSHYAPMIPSAHVVLR